jgi:hypothetical protein
MTEAERGLIVLVTSGVVVPVARTNPGFAECREPGLRAVDTKKAAIDIHSTASLIVEKAFRRWLARHSNESKKARRQAGDGHQ